MAPVRTVTVRLAADVGNYVTGLGRNAVKATRDLSNELSALGQQHKDKFNQLALAGGALGLTLTGAFGAVTRAATEFDKEMSAVASVTNASGKALSDLRVSALQAGKDTAFSATEAAQAEEELAKAGISTADIMGGALTGSLSLAAAGQMDLADAATIAAQAMNIFHLKGSDVGHIADVLAASANSSAADMHGLGDSLKQGGLVASQFGLTLEDTVGTLSAFADRALVGSDAGTSLKTMLQALANPSKKSAALMQQLGISAYDVQGKFIGITTLAGQLQDKLGGLTQAQRDEALAQIFGSDAMRAANVLYTQGSTGIQRYIDQVDQQGAAAQTAATKMNNLAGDVEQLKGSLETLAISSSGGATSGLRALTQGATGAVNAFTRLPAPISETVTIVAGLGGAGLLAGTGLAKARQSAQETLGILRDMGPTGGKAAEALSAIGSTAGKLGLAGVAAFGLYEGISALFAVLPKAGGIAPDVDKLTDSISRLGRTGTATGELARLFGEDLTGLAKHTKEVQDAISKIGGAGGPQVVQGYLQALSGEYKALDQSLAALVQGGNATAAKVLIDRLVEAGVPLDQLTKNLPQYFGAANSAAGGTQALAQGFGDATTNARTLTQSLQDATRAGQSLTDVWNQLHGAMLNSDQAALDAVNAIDDVTQSLKDNGLSVTGNTKAALENRVAVESAAQAASKVAQAKLDETGSLDEANATYQQYISQLRAALIQAGLTKKQVDDLLSSFAKMPPLVTTTVQTPGLVDAINQAGSLSALLSSLPAQKRITVTSQYISENSPRGGGRGAPATYQRYGGIHYAADGLLSLSQANVYPAGSRPLYGFAESGTMGEGFVPRNGDYNRSTSIIDQEARWYGGRFMPGAAVAAASQPPEPPVFNVVLAAKDGAQQAIINMIDVRIEQANGRTAAAVSGGVRL